MEWLEGGELGTVGAGAGVGHGQDARARVLQRLQAGTNRQQTGTNRQQTGTNRQQTGTNRQHAGQCLLLGAHRAEAGAEVRQARKGGG